MAAEDAVLRISGVKAVANELNIELPSASERSDEDIAKAALNAFKWDTAVPYDRIKVSVDKGKVILSGEVDWRFQKDAAEQNVCNLWGVQEVINEIIVSQKQNQRRLSPRLLVRSKIGRAHV